MKLDPGMHIGMHLVFFGKSGVTPLLHPLSVGPTRFPLLPPHRYRCKIWGRGGEDDVALWDPRVGKENRETAGAGCALGMKIFLLHPHNNFI
jgi:hypothetical protein